MLITAQLTGAQAIAFMNLDLVQLEYMHVQSSQASH